MTDLEHRSRAMARDSALRAEHVATVFPATRVRRPARRATDHRLVANPLARLLEASDDTSVVGRLLLSASTVVIVLAAPLLQPTRHGWYAVAVAVTAMVAAIVVSGRLDWARLPEWATVGHPALAGLALAEMGIVEPGTFSPLVGVMTLCFTFIGLTQSPGSSVFAVVPATAVYLITFGTVTTPILVRLLVAMLVWLLLAELLALLSTKHTVLTAALRAAASLDALTGVANRSGWEARIAAAAHGDVVVVLDIDHFKRINDVHGHAVGDEVLIDFGELLATSLRDNDFCARYGGEEFALLLPATSREQAAQVLARLHRRWERMRPEITFSAGVAPCRGGRGAGETFVAADGALYRAKTSGRDRDCFEEPANLLR